MDLTVVALIVCMCLASAIIGMVLMAIILHPYRKEVKRAWQREMQAQQRKVARQQLQRQLRDLDQ